MRTVSVTNTKDEADIVGPFVRHMAAQVDHVIVMDNGSTDGTREILDDLSASLPLTVRDDPEPYPRRQWAKVSQLAEMAGLMGADWVVAADTDEVWGVTGGGRISDRYALSPLDAGLVHDPVYFVEEPMASSSGAKKAETAKANAAARTEKLAALDNVQATLAAAERTAELARQQQQSGR